MSKTRILLVEDDAILRDLCAAVLRHHSFDPIITANGVDGLEAYRERHEEISLVLSDVTMPLMGGIEMVRNIFEMQPQANVILMSGYGLSDVVPDELRRLCSVVAKPFTPRVLIEAVKKCLRYDEEHHSGASSN